MEVSLAVLAASGLALALVPSLASGAKAEERPARVVLIGDSITDGCTYQLLIEQSLRAAGIETPLFTNAAIAGDTARGMARRLDRDVMGFRPTLVTLSVGANDVLRNVKLDEFKADVTAIGRRMKDEAVPMIVMTTCIMGPKHQDADERLAAYNAVLREMAAEFGYRIADVNTAMDQARRRGANLLSPDDVHLNAEGYRVLARTLLDAMGYEKVALVPELKLAPMPGIIAEWRMKALEGKPQPLDEKAAAALSPDETWVVYRLPETQPLDEWWPEQERQRGFAMSVQKLVGPGKGYIGMATIESAGPRTVFFNTGAQLQAIWLNGRKLYQSEGWTGWHAGKERIMAELRAGTNTVVIETSGQFFLSVTDRGDW